MLQLTVVSVGDGAAVALPRELMESLGLQIGDVIDATVTDHQLILRPAENAAREHRLEEITREVFAERADAYRRLA